MKKIILALAAVMAMSSAAIAQPGHGERDWRHDGRHNSHRNEHRDRRVITDRVERDIVRGRDGRRILITKTSKCTDVSRRGPLRCNEWTTTTTRRELSRR